MNTRCAGLLGFLLVVSVAAHGAELGVQHQRLAFLSGRWSVKQSLWAGQKNPPKVDRGTAIYTTVLGGRHLRQDLHIDSPSQPFDGLGYLGFNDATGRYYSTWMDINFTGMIVAYGDFDPADNTYTFKGDMPDASRGGASIPLREVLRVADDDHFSYDYFETRDGKESLAVRLEYTRLRPN